MLHRLREEIVGTRLDGTHTRRDVTVPRQEDHGHPLFGALQFCEQIEPVQVGESDIEDDTPAFELVQGNEKLVRRAERPHVESCSRDECAHRFTQLGIVVDNENVRLPRRHRAYLSGRVVMYMRLPIPCHEWARARRYGGGYTEMQYGSAAAAAGLVQRSRGKPGVIRCAFA